MLRIEQEMSMEDKRKAILKLLNAGHIMTEISELQNCSERLIHKVMSLIKTEKPVKCHLNS